MASFRRTLEVHWECRLSVRPLSHPLLTMHFLGKKSLCLITKVSVLSLKQSAITTLIRVCISVSLSLFFKGIIFFFWHSRFPSFYKFSSFHKGEWTMGIKSDLFPYSEFPVSPCLPSLEVFWSSKFLGQFAWRKKNNSFSGKALWTSCFHQLQSWNPYLKGSLGAFLSDLKVVRLLCYEFPETFKEFLR